MKPNESQDTNKINRIYRAKLSKLCKSRYGNHCLPVGDTGLAMLTALLCFGLTDESAIQDAPWCAAELEGLKRQARRWSWRDVGKLINLTYDEREDYKLWILDPCDVSRKEVQRRQAEKQAKADKERKKRQRLKQREDREAMRSTNDRRGAILRMLNDISLLFPERSGVVSPPRSHSPFTYQGWAPVSRLVELAKQSRAFRRPDGKPLRNLRDAVHCTVKGLANNGAIATRLEPGQRGSVLLVKAAAVGKPDAFSDGRSVVSGFPEKARRTKAFEPQAALSAGKTDTVPTPFQPIKRKAA